jgi:CheY-like chemotaxis protein
VEWRPYLILRQRYIEGLNLAALAEQLSLSERQLRRDNSRAVQALAQRLWDRLFLAAPAEKTVASLPAGTRRISRQTFETQMEVLDINAVVRGVAAVLAMRVEAEGLTLTLLTLPDPLQVVTDRVVARQVLISLISYLLNFPCEHEIQVSTLVSEQNASVQIQAQLQEPWMVEEQKGHEDLLEAARYWSDQLGGRLSEWRPVEGETGSYTLVFSLPLAERPLILVVDDQIPTQQMFRRFLSRSPYQIRGIVNPDQVLPLARQLQPALITLDIMMPKVDGWELLQALKTDFQTKDIPVLVCSAWEEPELAASLGAAGFLKKPVRQRDLLEALARLGL